jgi:uncharacterized protein
MLVDQIRAAMIQARKSGDPVAKSLLVTLYSEVVRVGKDRRNGETTDDETVAVIRKFMTNTQETRKHLQARSQSAEVQDREIEMLSAYLPRQISESELAEIINRLVASLGEGTNMGAVMAGLKANHGGRYDARVASQLVKAVLTNKGG